MPLRRYLATRQMPQMVHLFTLIHLKLAFWAIYQPHCSPGSPVRTHSAFPQLLNVSQAQAYHLTRICQQRAIQKKILCDSTIFAVSTLLRCNLPHFCLFLTDPKYHLGISNNSTFQELQFEHKRSLLAQFAREI